MLSLYQLSFVVLVEEGGGQAIYLDPFSLRHDIPILQDLEINRKKTLVFPDGFFLDFVQDIKIVCEPFQLLFQERLSETQEENEFKVQKITADYFEKLSHKRAPYTAVGINLKAAVTFDKDTQNIFVEKFGLDRNRMDYLSVQPDIVEMKFSYKMTDKTISLAVQPIENKDQNTHKIEFHANIHRDLKGENSYTQIVDVIKSYEQDISTIKDLIKKTFLGEFTHHE